MSGLRRRRKKEGKKKEGKKKEEEEEEEEEVCNLVAGIYLLFKRGRGEMEHVSVIGR